MNRRNLTASVLASAVGLTAAAAVTPATSSPLGAGMKAAPATTSNIVRAPHHRALLDTLPAVDWMEVHSENYLSEPGLAVLEEVRAHSSC